MTEAVSRHGAQGHKSAVADDVVDLAARCARPGCREEFHRTPARGRPQEYCTDVCRRLADKELKQARAVVAHYERQLRLAQIDEAAFGRGNEDAEAFNGPDRRAREAQARGALGRAQVVVEYGTPEDPRAMGELRKLVLAVGALLEDDLTPDSKP